MHQLAARYTGWPPREGISPASSSSPKMKEAVGMVSWMARTALVLVFLVGAYWVPLLAAASTSSRCRLHDRRISEEATYDLPPVTTIVGDAIETSNILPSPLVSSSSKAGPVGVSFSGGGFRAMTTAMAFGRAFSEAEVLDDITHLASNSGGSWFGGQFLYSEKFYRAVTDSKEDIGRVIQQWFDDAYKNRNDNLPEASVFPGFIGSNNHTLPLSSLKADRLSSNKFAAVGSDPKLLIDDRLLEAVGFDSSKGLPSWDDIADFLQKLLEALERIPGKYGDLASMAALAPQFQDWSLYIRRLMVWPGLSDMEVTFSTARRTLKKPTFIVAASLPASNWFTNPDKEFDNSTESVTLDLVPRTNERGTAAAKQVADLMSKGAVVPAAFCSPGHSATAGSWILNPSVKGLKLKRHTSDAFASPLDSANDTAALALPTDPSLGTVLGGSSAAAGLLSDPYQLLQFAENLLKDGLLPGWASKVPGLIKSLRPLLARHFIGAGVNAYGLDHEPSESSSDWTKQLQLIDGAYTDNTAAASLIARMQRDCGSTCSTTTLRAVVVDSSAAVNATGENGSVPLASLFKSAGGSSPSSPGEIVPSPLTYGATYQPQAQIFTEAYPDRADKAWSDYVMADTDSGVPPSRVWVGTVTTVQNDWYAVEGGWTVELMMFAVNSNLRTIVSPENLRDAALTAPYVHQNNAQVEGLGKMADAIANFMGAR